MEEDALFEIRGLDGSVLVYSDRIRISRPPASGLSEVLSDGSAEKEILLSQIADIEIKQPEGLNPGLVRFLMVGEKAEEYSPLFGDKTNAVLFDPAQKSDFIKLKEQITRTPRPSQKSPAFDMPEAPADKPAAGIPEQPAAQPSTLRAKKPRFSAEDYRAEQQQDLGNYDKPDDFSKVHETPSIENLLKDKVNQLFNTAEEAMDENVLRGRSSVTYYLGLLGVGLALIFGTFFGPIMGIAAISLGQTDLKKVTLSRFDSAIEKRIRTGMTFGVASFFAYFIRLIVGSAVSELFH